MALRELVGVLGWKVDTEPLREATREVDRIVARCEATGAVALNMGRQTSEASALVTSKLQEAAAASTDLQLGVSAASSEAGARVASLGGAAETTAATTSTAAAQMNARVKTVGDVAEGTARQVGTVGRAFERVADVGSRAVARVRESISRIPYEIRRLEKPLVENKKKFAVAFAAGAGAIGLMTNASANLEAALSSVAATAGATAEEYDVLKAAAIDLGIRTQFSAQQAAAGMELLAQRGFGINQIVAAMPGLLDAAAAAQVDLATATDIVTAALRAYGLEASESQRVADILAKASVTSGANMIALGETLSYAAGTAKGLNIPLEDLVAAAGRLGDVGILGSRAGTALSTAMTRLAAPTGEAGRWIQKMGLQVTDTAGNMRSFPVLLEEIGRATAEWADTQKAAAFRAIFGEESMRGMMALFAEGIPDIRAYSKLLRESTGAAADIAAKKLDNLKGTMTLLASSVQIAMITIGDRFNPIIRAATTLVMGAVNVFNRMPGPLQTLIALGLGLGVALAGVTAALAFGLGYWSRFAQAAGMVHTAILRLIPALQAVGPAALKSLLPTMTAIGPFVAVLGGLAAAFLLVQDAIMYLRGEGDTLTGRIVGWWNRAAQWLSATWQEMGVWAKTAAGVLGAVLLPVVISTSVAIGKRLVMSFVGAARSFAGTTVGAVKASKGLLVFAKTAVVTAARGLAMLTRGLAIGTARLVAFSGKLYWTAFKAMGVFAKQAAVAVATAIPGLISGLGTATSAVVSFGAALLANPLTWYVTAGMALVGVIYLLVRHWDKLGGVVSWVGDKLFAIGRFVANIFVGAFRRGAEFVGGFGRTLLSIAAVGAKVMLAFSPMVLTFRLLSRVFAYVREHGGGLVGMAALLRAGLERLAEAGRFVAGVLGKVFAPVAWVFRGLSALAARARDRQYELAQGTGAVNVRVRELERAPGILARIGGAAKSAGSAVLGWLSTGFDKVRSLLGTIADLGRRGIVEVAGFVFGETEIPDIRSLVQDRVVAPIQAAAATVREQGGLISWLGRQWQTGVLQERLQGLGRTAVTVLGRVVGSIWDVIGPQKAWAAELDRTEQETVSVLDRVRAALELPSINLLGPVQTAFDAVQRWVAGKQLPLSEYEEAEIPLLRERVASMVQSTRDWLTRQAPLVLPRWRLPTLPDIKADVADKLAAAWDYIRGLNWQLPDTEKLLGTLSDVAERGRNILAGLFGVQRGEVGVRADTGINIPRPNMLSPIADEVRKTQEYVDQHRLEIPEYVVPEMPRLERQVEPEIWTTQNWLRRLDVALPEWRMPPLPEVKEKVASKINAALDYVRNLGELLLPKWKMLAIADIKQAVADKIRIAVDYVRNLGELLLPKWRLPAIADVKAIVEDKVNAALDWVSGISGIQLPPIKLPEFPDIVGAVQNVWDAARQKLIALLPAFEWPFKLPSLEGIKSWWAGLWGREEPVTVTPQELPVAEATEEERARLLTAPGAEPVEPVAAEVYRQPARLVTGPAVEEPISRELGTMLAETEEAEERPGGVRPPQVTEMLAPPSLNVNLSVSVDARGAEEPEEIGQQVTQQLQREAPELFRQLWEQFVTQAAHRSLAEEVE